MNINDYKKQQLIDHAAFILAISEEKDNPSPQRWEEIKLSLREHSWAITTLIIPKIEDEPAYTSGSRNGTIAKFEPRNASISDLEVKPEDSSAGTPFLAPQRPDKES